MPGDSIGSSDPRALKILFDTFWTSEGWRNPRSTAAADFEYAKRAGVMFDDVQLSHDDIVDRTITAVRAVDSKAVADSFVASLSSRRLELRSALGSFAVFQYFSQHNALPGDVDCPVCGVCGGSAKTKDLNVLNLERFKWGGVRHDQPLYASIDLELFQVLPPAAPNAADIGVLKKLLHTIKAAPEKTSATSLQKTLAKVLDSNKAERDVLIGILGLCGVLGTATHPGYMQKFIPVSEREIPSRRFVDMAYPACRWEQSDGINQEAVSYWFGHLL